MFDDPDFVKEVFEAPIDYSNDYDDAGFLDDFMNDYFNSK